MRVWHDTSAGNEFQGAGDRLRGTAAPCADTNKASSGSSFTAVAAGWTHTCAMNAAGGVACWSLAHQSQIGNDDSGSDGDGSVDGEWTTNASVQGKLAGSNLDGTGTSLVCPGGAPGLSDTTFGLWPEVAYGYRVGHTSPDIVDWSSETVTAVRR